MARRITLSTSKPATKLIDYAKRLTDDERSLLRWRIRDGERMIVFNVAANGAVTLAEQPARFATERIIDPATGEEIVAEGQAIDAAVAERLSWLELAA